MFDDLFITDNINRQSPVPKSASGVFDNMELPSQKYKTETVVLQVPPEAPAPVLNENMLVQFLSSGISGFIIFLIAYLIRLSKKDKKLTGLEDKSSENYPVENNLDKEKGHVNLNKIFNFIKKNYKILLIILLIIGAFYWWELRPSQIKSECAKWALEKAKDSKGMYEEDVYRDYYSRCLHEHGI